MSNDQTHLLKFDALPVAVDFDPGNNILKNANQIGVGVATPARPPSLTASVVPNPGGRRVRLDFMLPEAGDAVLEVYDVKGRLAGRVTQNGLSADSHSIALTGDTPGLDLERSGVYFYRLRAAGRVATGKFTIIR